MRNILSLAQRAVLQQFAWSRVLLAFDFDGTLAPIVPRPEAAQLRARTRRLLGQLSGRYPCVVITGRAQGDARGRLVGTGVHGVVGNHGVEPWRSTRTLSAQVRRWWPRLEAALGGLQGVALEDKVFSLAIHYRRSRQKKRAREEILRATAELEGVRVVGGKQVVNLLPQGAPDKGMALERERERFGCDTALYLGDDETDEDVFGLDRPGRLLTIRVGPKAASAAAYCVPNQAAVDSLLALLLRLRRGGPARGARTER